MDSITHLTLGICTGEIILRKRLGKAALIWGAAAQCLPDIDTAATLFYRADKAFLIHRGLTHSLVFVLIAGFILALIAARVHRSQNPLFILLVIFFCFQLLLHDLLDCCNSYGTGLLEPFSHHRFSVNLLYVADPFFTLSMLVVSLLLIFKPLQNHNRIAWAYVAISLSAAYVCLAVFNKLQIDNRLISPSNTAGLQPSNYFTTPAPFNCLLWYIVAKNKSGYFTAYSSVFDDRKKAIRFERHNKNEGRLKYKDTALLHNLINFADNDYTITQRKGKNYFNILRFEQIQGWGVQDAEFSFSYPLDDNTNDAALLQKGRLSGWNLRSFNIYMQRLTGHETINN